ncbi:hypothetical protein ACSYG2_09785 [Leptospira interrogans serovar Icterohaemorrhagiae]|uniref:Uncharacterized protein n=2 Tax=Leptospira interrogans TaxID=173 RepID=A0A0E2D0D8_LEPIR|nr:hypothetical protein [Leptospira interrogans]EKO23774.1 hypothetical protein LEP1GSC104_2305 [Leptospira interrogans str. UI 12621]EKR53038.1 hypothetical protein LEP1GSC105_1800 [Leptospira interrogans str. UI 12758]
MGQKSSFPKNEIDFLFSWMRTILLTEDEPGIRDTILLNEFRTKMNRQQFFLDV